jgi:thiol-disulfide isomerase/thioredoxin
VIRTFLVSLFCLGLVAQAATNAPQPRPSPEFTIHLIPSGDISPTQYKGKVVVLAFILTTCPHCQRAVGMLNGLQTEYGPRGLQVIGAAVNSMSNMLVPDFNKQFRPNFPIGWAMHQDMLTYLNHSVMTPPYMPSLVFIDRKGMIRYQRMGDDPLMTSDQEKNVREAIEELLKEGSAGKKAPVTSAKKKA